MPLVTVRVVCLLLLMPHEPHRIEAALAHLVGLPLWASPRSADMQGFHFGAQRTGVARYGPRKGEPVIHGEFALHVQCAWRISAPGGIYVASRDLYSRSKAALDAAEDDWDWSVSGSNRRDELVASWLTARAYTVEGQSADRCGGFTLRLSDGYQLQVFPDVSDDSECWRLLFNDDSREHFVVLGNGIEA